MQNPSLGSKVGSKEDLKESTTKTLQGVAENVREKMDTLTSGDFTQKARSIANDSMESANEAYNKASVWVQGNYGKTLSMVGVLTAVGVIGYLLGKSNNRSSYQFPKAS